MKITWMNILKTIMYLNRAKYNKLVILKYTAKIVIKAKPSSYSLRLFHCVKTKPLDIRDNSCVTL